MMYPKLLYKKYSKQNFSVKVSSQIHIPDKAAYCKRCVDECDVFNYAVAVSYSQLSVLSPDSFLSSDSDHANLSEKYHRALEVRHRVEKDYLISLITTFNSLEKKYDNFRDYINFYILNGTTSVIHRTQTVLKRMDSAIAEDINEVLFLNLKSYTTDYNEQLHPLVMSVSAALNDVALTATQLAPRLLAWSPSTSVSLDADYSQGLLGQTIRAIIKLNETLSVYKLHAVIYKTADQTVSTLIPVYLQYDKAERNKCSENEIELTGTGEKSLAYALGKLTVGYHLNKTYPSSADSEIMDLQVILRELSKSAMFLERCFGQYKEFLEELTSWVRQIVEHYNSQSDIVTYDSTNIVSMLEQDSGYLKSLIQDYIENKTTKLALAEAIGGRDMARVKRHIHSIGDIIDRNMGKLISDFHLHNQIVSNTATGLSDA